MIPGSITDKIISFDGSRGYSGQFSDDGNFFFSCSQDFKVRMYDTSNPYDWKYYKTVDYPFGGWTITDATLSPDNRFLAYSSMNNVVCLASTDPADNSDPSFLSFVSPNARGRLFGPRFSVSRVIVLLNRFCYVLIGSFSDFLCPILRRWSGNRSWHRSIK